MITESRLLRADAETRSGGSPRPPPDAMIVVPVRGFVLLPGTVFPVTLGRERSIHAAQQAVDRAA